MIKTLTLSAFLAFYSFLTQGQCPADAADFLNGGVFTGPCVVNLGGASTITGNVTFTGDLNVTVTTLTVTNNFSFGGGTLSIFGAPGNLVVGTVATAGSLSIVSGGAVNANDVSSGSVTLTNGSITLASGTSLAAYGAVLSATGTTINNRGTITNATAVASTLAGAYNGLAPGVLDVDGDLRFNGALDLDDNSSVSGVNLTVNTATVDGDIAASGMFTLNNNRTMTIGATGTITSTMDFRLNAGSNTTNNGIIEVTDVNGDLRVAGTLLNNNILNITGETITVINGGSLTIAAGATGAGGTLDVNAGGTLTINGGTLTTSGTGDNTMNGTVVINGGVTNFGGDLVVDGATASVTMNGGTVNINGVDGDLEVTSGGTITVNGGDLNIQDDLTTAGSNGNIIINTVTVDVDGDVIIAATGSLTSTNATTPGSIDVQGGFTDNHCTTAPTYAAGSYTFCNCPSYTACIASLPVELKNFSGIQEGNTVILYWTTLTETNNHYFTVERLLTNDEFEKVLTVEGRGTTSLPEDYAAIDNHPLPGRNYYRLRQTDFDRKTSTSNLIKVDVKLQRESLEIYPNPTIDGKCSVYVNSMKTIENLKIVVTNSLGKMVLIKELIAIEPNQLAHSLDIGELPPGVYFVSANQLTKKLIKH